MKALILIISVISIAAFIGCMDNNLTQPETAADYSFSKIPSSGDISPRQILKGEIKLCCELCDPQYGNCGLHGSVLYIHTTLSNIGGVARVKINLTMNSELYTPLMNCAPYLISGCSCDTVYLIGMGVSFIEKNYEIKNRPDIRLGVRFKLTLEGVEITDTRLHQIDASL